MKLFDTAARDCDHRSNVVKDDPTVVAPDEEDVFTSLAADEALEIIGTDKCVTWTVSINLFYCQFC